MTDLARFLVGEIAEVSATLETFVKERPLVDNPKKRGKVTVDDASLALIRFANGAVGTIEATRFAPGRKNYNRFEINGSKGSLVFNLERLNHLEFLDATEPATQQWLRDLLVMDMKHPVFPNFWRPGHIIGYEHTFIAALAEFLQCLSKNEEFHPNFSDGLAEEILGQVLMTWHNLRYYQDLMASLRAAIGAGRLKEFAGRFMQEQARGDIEPI